MHSKPVIFISAVSGEFRTARDVVAKALVALGYEPKWQDIAPAEHGSLRGVLRKWIDHSVGVLQILGERYGAEPAAPDSEFGRCSYTQFEAHYARQRGKKVWYLFADDTFLRDPAALESAELTDLQARYLAQVKASGDTRHRFTNPLELENTVLRLRDDLARLRRRGRQWAAAVLALLVLVAGGNAWVLHQQNKGARLAEQTRMNSAAAKESADKAAGEAAAAREEVAKLRESMNAFPEVKSKLLEAAPGRKSEGVEEKTYAELAKLFSIDANLLRKKLPDFAEELRHAPDATTFERANAAFVRKDYPEAGRLALAAAAEALKATPPRDADAIKAYELAGWSARERIEYADALRNFREAEKLTDRARDPLEWARLQWNMANILLYQGQYDAAETAYRAALEEYQRAHGAEGRDVLSLLTNLASALYGQGKYAKAEQEYRGVMSMQEFMLGPEHPDFLLSWNGLALALDAQGKSAEAEREHRARIAIEERVLGPENPNVLGGRDNLGLTLRAQDKSAEAEQEHRAVLAIMWRVRGPEHPDTLRCRSNLASALGTQDKHAEAEQEFRALLTIHERVLGSEHPSVLMTSFNLAIALKFQKKYQEALGFAQRAERGRQKVLGAEHPETQDAMKLREWIEGKLKGAK